MKDVDGYYEVKIENLSNFSGQLKKGIINCLTCQIAGFTDCGSKRSVPICDGSSLLFL